MDKNWHKLERLLRQGERTAAVRALHELARARPARSERLPLARLYRKAGLPGRSLQVLGPWKEQSSELHRAEYGAALVNLGALREGMRVLDSLSDPRDPRVGWLKAAVHIRAWDWKRAIPLLESLPQSEMYLATCLIHGSADYDRAARILERMLRAPGLPAPQDDPRLAQSTAWLLLAQCRVLAGALREATQALRRARETLPPLGTGHHTLHTWMLREWELLLALRRSGGEDRAALRELLGPVQAGFRALEGWEWARGCPLFAAELRQDRAAMLELYWTTPYPAFRERVRPQLGKSLRERHLLRLASESSTQIFRAGARGATLRWRVDVATGLVSRGGATVAQLKPLQAGHRLLLALASDFHQPHPIAALHEQLFPDESYRPEVSADRVHKVLQRLRLWLDSRGIPLEVSPGRGGYRLSSRQGCELLLSLPASREARPAGPVLRTWVREARKAFGTAPFSASEALGALGGARRTVARRLSEAAAAGLIERRGSKIGAAYRVASQSR